MSRRRVLVVTIVHHPHDGRIRARQIQALLAAGWQVTYAAPWTGYGLTFPEPMEQEGLTCVDIPRARGRRRVAAVRAAREMLRHHAVGHDVVLVHDPELVLAIMGLRLPPVIWDVHEDTAAALEVREWLPRLVRVPAAAAVRAVEKMAERRLTLLLAEAGYSSRFVRRHPVVPNSTWVHPDPPPAAVRGPDGRYRVVYLGSVTMERGAAELVAIGRMLRERAGAQVRLEVIGPAHGAAGSLLREACERGDLTWTGYLANAEALDRVSGALAGLSLLHDEANFRPSMPTKVVEYLAHAVPVITTPLPLAVDLVVRGAAGQVVPFAEVDQVAGYVIDQVLAWAADPTSAIEAGRSGHRLVRAKWSWERDSQKFVAALERVAEAAATS